MAFDLLKKEINEKNLSEEAKIEFIYEDDKSTPETAESSVKKLINEEKIDALIISSTSSVCFAAVPPADEKKIPVLVSFAMDDNITSLGKYIFRTCYDDMLEGNAIAKFSCSSLKAKKAALIYDAQDNYSKNLSDSFKQNFEKSGGTIVSFKSFDKGEEGLNNIIYDIKSKKS